MISRMNMAFLKEMNALFAALNSLLTIKASLKFNVDMTSSTRCALALGSKLAKSRSVLFARRFATFEKKIKSYLITILNLT